MPASSISFRRLVSLFAASLAFLLIFAFSPLRAEPAKLLRFPDIHGNTIVFTYAGDIWKVSASGGMAARLTSAPGVELFPKISPDGKWIAFTGQYDGDEQVYVMPIDGGIPRQLTFYPAEGPLPARWGYDNQVFGWSPDGKSIVFRSLRDRHNLFDGKLFTVPFKGGLPKALPMPIAGAGAFSPDQTKIVYSPHFRGFRTWKHYHGGWAEDLYIFDLASHSATNITSNIYTDRDPMWVGDNIFFNSDRDGRLNIYRYATNGGALTELTHYKKWDIRWPSADTQGRIVYELDGTLHVLDTASGAIRDLDIEVPTDGANLRPQWIDVEGQVEDFGLSPKGERAVMTARGDIFTLPAEHGVTRNLTQSSTAHDREAAWSPDGSRIAYISDRTGEEELWLQNQDGTGNAAQLTSGDKARFYHPVWSPDGKRIAYENKDGKIFVVEVASKKVTEVADDRGQAALDYNWSPDGMFLAFSMGNPNEFRSLYIWAVEGAKLHRVSDEMFNEREPVFDPSGTYLYYLSDREFAPQAGSFEWNYTLTRETGIFARALTRDAVSPFPPRNDEVAAEKSDDKSKKETKKGEKKPAVKPVKIDFDGLADRVIRVPVNADNISQLNVTAKDLFYIVSGSNYIGRDSERKPVLTAFNIEKREAKKVAEDVTGYARSADGSTLLVASEKGFKLYKTAGGDPKPLPTGGLKLLRNPRQEWTEAFNEVWRRFRDYFYVANMNGVDWQAMGDKYRGLLKYVGDRSDLNYLMGEMIGELNNSHSYVSGGDLQLPRRPDTALLGARFELDAKADRYRIAKIFAGQNAEPRYRSPLTEVGVDVHVGDYLLAIDGRQLMGDENPYQLLRGLGGRSVELTVSSKPDLAGARRVVVDPLKSESRLMNLAWVTHNRERVARESDGKIGYLYIPDMLSDGIYEFIKSYYSQIRKDGLVIDVRSNGGGNISQMLIDRLSRRLLSVTYPRTSDNPSTYPSTTFTGPMATVINETSASDGDIFPWSFRQAGLGPLIGKRSWGGVIGITDHGPLIDGGNVEVPEFGFVGADGKWVVEGHGVDPDIEVDNDPASVIAGKDPQLDRAVQEVLTLMKTHKAKLPPRPAAPDRAWPEPK